MKYLLLTTFSLFALCTQAQATKKVKNKISKDKIEEYFVLESDGITKQGQYIYYEFDKIITSGNYKDGKKDGFWTYYIWNGTKKSEGFYKNDMMNGHWKYFGYKEFLIREGDYVDDLRVGIWKLYHNNKLTQEFDFDKNKLNVIDTETTNSNKIIYGGKFDGLIMVDNNASYIEGPQELNKFISSNFKYPEEVINKGISGHINVSALLNIDGSLTDFKVDKGIDSILDNQLINVLKLTEGKWNLAEFLNEKVMTRVRVSISIR